MIASIADPQVQAAIIAGVFATIQTTLTIYFITRRRTKNGKNGT